MAGTETSNIAQKGQNRTAKETWNILLNYAGRWRWLIWVSMIAAALGTVVGIVPYAYIHQIIHSILDVNPLWIVLFLAWLSILSSLS